MNKDALPYYRTLIGPTLEAMREMGGGGRKIQISEIVAEKANLTDEQLSLTTRSGVSSFGLLMNKVRKYLLKAELITHPHKGHWQLTDKGWAIEGQSLDEISREPRNSRPQTPSSPPPLPDAIPIDELIESYTRWQDALAEVLLQLSPASIARFFERIFSSEGIDQIEAVNTNQAGEIDGVMVSEGFLTFRVAFKFLRGSKLISATEVEDFRRTVRAARADKGLLISTGSFTQEAIRDAQRGHSPIIELIDGPQFIHKLKERAFGIETERVIVERVVVNRDWFASL